MTERLRQRGKTVFVHLDLAEGIARDANGVQILAEIVRPDGVITTKNNLVRAIREYGMLAALRCLSWMDSPITRRYRSAATRRRTLLSSCPDPAAEPYCRILPETGAAVVAGDCAQRRGRQSGLCRRREGISTSDRSLWTLPIGAGNGTRGAI